MNDIRLCLVLSDLHCGSTCGLLPPKFETHEGNAIGQTPFQKWLWDCWEDALGGWLPGIVGKDKFALIVNGDCTEGNHHHTKEVISPDDGDHLKAATESLEYISGKAGVIFIVEGTEVHSHNLEHVLAKQLGAVPDPSNGRNAWKRLDVTVAETRCIFQHHVGASTRTWTEATGLGAALANEQLEAVRNGEKIVRVLGSAHRHRFGVYETDGGTSFVTHAWQGLTRFGRKVVPSARVNPGVVVLDWRDCPDDSAPELHARSYRMPQAVGVRL